MNEHTIFQDPGLTRIIFAVMCKKLGGHVHITQADIDQVAYNVLMEDMSSEGLKFDLIERRQHS